MKPHQIKRRSCAAGVGHAGMCRLLQDLFGKDGSRERYGGRLHMPTWPTPGERYDKFSDRSHSAATPVSWGFRPLAGESYKNEVDRVAS